MSEHEHRWQMTLHMDGCHFYSSAFKCECGAVATTYDERDPAEDPYSLVWMEPTSDEPCQRCEELIAGAKARHETQVTP